MKEFKGTKGKWQLDKAFYREVKKAAFADPKEWFDFNN